MAIMKHMKDKQASLMGTSIQSTHKPITTPTIFNHTSPRTLRRTIMT